MMKVAVYVDNGGSWHCDCTSIEQGNPGMAGTPYVMNLIGVLLQRRDNDIESVLLTHVDGHYADDVHTATVGSLAGAMSYAEAHNYDLSIMNGMKMLCGLNCGPVIFIHALSSTAIILCRVAC